VTDAHVVLGTLAPDAFLAGRRALDRGRAVAAIRANLAAPLGTTSEVAAAGIINVLEANMVAAIREISVGRGIAPAVRPGRRRWCWRPARHLHVLPHAYQIELAGKAETGM
jgi:N-methylhydantoinase A